MFGGNPGSLGFPPSARQYRENRQVRMIRKILVARAFRL